MKKKRWKKIKKVLPISHLQTGGDRTGRMYRVFPTQPPHVITSSTGLQPDY